MAQTITASHTPQDPVVGPLPAVTRSVTVGEWIYDQGSVTNALMYLFRQFDLPNGGTLRIEGYGKSLEWDYDDSLVLLARRLLGK